MASFISALSLFILILFNGCLTLPIINEQLLSSSSLNDDLTTGEAVNLRLVPDDETSVLPDIDKKRSKDEHLGFELSTVVGDLSNEKVAQALRTINELSTSEPTTSTNGQSSNKKRGHDDLLYTTIVPITHVDELKQRDFIDEVKDETETKNDKREMEVESTTSDMLLFTSTSSAVAPQFYTSESSTSTEKSIALPKDETEHEHEHRSDTEHDHEHDHEHKHEHDHEPEPEQEQTTKYMKTQRKATSETDLTPTRKSKDQLEDKSEEDSKEAPAPTAVFDQEALNKISNIPKDFMIIDENIDIVVTGLPDNISTSTIEYKKEEIPLNQGEQSLHTEEKKPNY